MKIVFATNNPNKLKEIQTLIPKEIEIISLKEIGCTEDIPETGDTLEANAFQKVHYVKENYNYDCFADDTGLEIDALNGEPGVYSARYAGENATFEENCSKVIAKLKGVDTNKRNAKFRTVIAYVTKDEKIHCEGSVDGRILDKKIGANGFGYDPIFYYPGLKKTFAELKKGEKNSISHRGKALRNFSKLLEKQINHKSIEI